MKIGFIKGFRPSEESFDNYFGENKNQINLEEQPCLSDGINNLKNKKIDFLIVPARATLTNDVNLLLIDTIKRLNIDHICETYTFIDKSVVLVDSKKSFFSDSCSFGTRFYKKEENSDYFDVRNKNFIEYKIFKRNDFFEKGLHKKSFLRKFYTTTLGDKVPLFFSLLVMALTIAILIFMLVKLNQEYQWAQIITASLPIIPLVFNLIESIFKFREKAIKKLITGYWLYYSFERDFVSGNFVPRGFTTRLLKIENIKNNLQFSCWMQGDDSQFFSTSEVQFEFDKHKSVGSGTYHYTSSFVNQNGLRADGVCSFNGYAEKGYQITSMNGWFSGRGTGIRGVVKYVRISKETFNTIYSNFQPTMPSSYMKFLKAGVFGDEKSNTDVSLDSSESINEFLTKNNFKMQRVYYTDVHEMLNDLITRRIDLCVMPWQNTLTDVTLAGKKPCELIKNLKQFNIVEKFEYKAPNTYCICSKEEISFIESDARFLSNDNVFRQCSKFLDGKKKTECLSSSTAAKEVSLGITNENCFAICNLDAARFYNLYPYKQYGEIFNPSDELDNLTIFKIFFNKEFDKMSK